MTRRIPSPACRISALSTAAAAVWLALAAAPSPAAIIANEPFDYPGGDLPGLGSGADPGWAGGWSEVGGAGGSPDYVSAVTAGSLDSPVVSNESGNKATLKASLMRRELDTAITSGTVYLGFVFQRNVNTPNTAHASLTYQPFIDSAAVSIGVANTIAPNQHQIGIQSISGFFSTGITSSIGVTYQLVAKIELNVSGSNDVISLFVNQATEGTPDATSSSVLVNHFPSGFDALLLRANTGTGGGSPQPAQSAHFDEVRFATTYAEALIPEPAAAAALLLAAAHLAPRRRQRGGR